VVELKERGCIPVLVNVIDSPEASVATIWLVPWLSGTKYLSGE
jgi:hypothetical protein